VRQERLRFLGTMETDLFFGEFSDIVARVCHRVGLKCIDEQYGAREELPVWNSSLFMVAAESLLVKPYCQCGTVLTKNEHDALGRRDETLLTNDPSSYF
jgi:hypothetical protein